MAGDTIEFNYGDLKAYWLKDFAHGKDFILSSWHGSQLVETARTEGVFVHMDSQGAPKLRDTFVDYMDKSTYGRKVPYERLAAIYNAMHRPNPETYSDERSEYLHKTLTWWAFWRRQGVTAEAFAQRMNVHERTVGKWLSQALRHVEKEVKSPVISLPLVLPDTYQPFEGRA